MSDFRLMVGDVFEQLALLEDESVDCCVTSPPYWGLRDYGYEGQIGLEPTLGEHLAVMVAVFEEVRRVLKPMGTCWINYGDCYAAKPNGRSAAATKAAGNDDRTFRDKPFSTIGPIYPPEPGQPFPKGVKRRGGGNAPAGAIEQSSRVPSWMVFPVEPIARFEHDDSPRQRSRRGRSGNLGNGHKQGIAIPNGRVVGDGGKFEPAYAKTVRGQFKDGRASRLEHAGRVTAGGYLKPKDLCMIPNRLAIALQDAGWWVRAENIWGKPNPMPDSSGRYRPSTAHEKVWLLTKSAKSYYDHLSVSMPVSGGTNPRVSQNVMAQAGSKRANGGTRADRPMKACGDFFPHDEFIDLPLDADVEARPQNPKAAAPGSGIKANTSFQEATCGVVERRFLRNYEPDLAPLDVWRIATASYADAHFATFPPALVIPCILAGCPIGGTVIDPFAGAGTTGLVAQALNRSSILIEKDEGYAEQARARVMNGDIGLGIDG